MPDIEFARMSNEEDFLYRPVLEGMMPEAALYDGSVSLYRIFLMNEALDVRAENEYRLNQHFRDSNG
jgi:hypothetical protein